MSHIMIAGGSGFIGRELGITLARQGHTITVLTRDPSQARLKVPYPCELISWPADENTLISLLANIDCVINLAGENLTEGRWTAAHRNAVKTSRTRTAKSLVSAYAKSRPEKKGTFIQASAVGYYGNTGEQEIDEMSPRGQGFLSEVCSEWEQPAKDLMTKGFRTIITRFGVVLGLGGGALSSLVDPQRLGLRIAPGGGKQWVSWVLLDDVTAFISQAAVDPQIKGIFNLTAPAPCRMHDLVSAIPPASAAGSVKSIPPIAIRLALGEGAVVVNDSQKILPMRALNAGFSFRATSIDQAFAHLFNDRYPQGAAWLYRRQWIESPLMGVSHFFCDESNLEAITPDWLKFRVTAKSTPAIEEGTRIRYKLHLHGIPLSWESLISEWQPNSGFMDEQKRGPFAIWQHRHTFEALGSGTLITDKIWYREPLGPLGIAASSWLVKRDVNAIFDYRQKIIAQHFSSIGSLTKENYS